MSTPTPTSSFRQMLAKRETKKYKMMGQEILIQKLTVAEVRQIRETATDKPGESGNDELGLGLLIKIVKFAVPDAVELEDSEFEQFPMDELQKLSAAIMEFSGFSDVKK